MQKQFDSLRSPLDIKAVGVTTRSLNHPPLTEKELGEALESKVKSLMFPQIDRQYADPPLMNQKICLVSFIPSSGARPDSDNIYGMMKVRGVFATEEEANERAEMLIRNHDSYHEIFHAFVGRPFPVTNEEGFEKELQTIDIRKKTVKLISEDILSKKREEEKEVREMQDREKNLLDQSKRAKEDLPEDPYDIYITDQVKRAQLIWTYRETMKKCLQMKDIIKTTNETIAKTEADHPEFLDQYRDKYMAARKEAGLEEKQDDDSFIKYLGVDQLPGLDEL
jgi:hypothetical protein